MSKKSSKTTAAKAKPSKLMYVGPTVIGGLAQNTVYEGMPAVVEKIKETCPLVANLFVPIEKYPEASRQISAGQGPYHSAWKAVTAYKVKNNA